MQRATTHIAIPWLSPRLRLPTTMSKLLGALSVVIGTLLVMTFVLVWMVPTIHVDTLFGNSQIPSATEFRPSATDRIDDAAAFDRSVQSVAYSDSPEAYQMLLQSLKQGGALSQRNFVLTTLKDASTSVVPVLMAAMNDANPSVRSGAAQVLGLRREYQAVAALTLATHDPDAGVRREAVVALGSLGAWEVLPRLEQLQVNETNYAVRQAAFAAEESFKSEMAQAIGVPVSELRDVSVTSADVPQIYAVTTSNLYALFGTDWRLVSRLPDIPQALATGNHSALIYLATVNSGLYRSLDGGETWDSLQFGLATPTQLTVTAVVVDPQDSRQFFIALAVQGVKADVKNPIGIYANNDGGATWSLLPASPSALITTRLVIDPQQRAFLFGMTSDTPWRYKLPPGVCEYCLD